MKYSSIISNNQKIIEIKQLPITNNHDIIINNQQ